MYLLIKDKVERVSITNIEPEKDYIFIEDTKFYKRYKKIGCDDILVFKIENMESLKQYLLSRTDQDNLRARYEAQHPISYYEYVRRKLKTFLNYFNI